jgi:hypothetical protein
VTGLAEAKSPRVVVLSLSYHPPRSVRSYVDDLVNVGVEVDLLLAETRSTDDLEVDPRVKVHTVLEMAEVRLPLRRVERALVFTVWERSLGKARSLTADRKALRPIDLVLEGLQLAQRKASRAFHHRIFWPVFRVVRPWVLARRGRELVQQLDLAGADRIVAGDPPAVPLAWRLARKYPLVRATTALDRKPYVPEKKY